MPTDKQIEANRRNAQLSTGPRTPEGCAASRLNAYKHGLTGHLDVMTDEQKEARDAFIAEIADELHPLGSLERQLAHSIAETQWRINRVAVIENNMFAADAWLQERDRRSERPAQAEGDAGELDAALASARTFINHPESFNLLTVYEMRLFRKMQSELRQLRDLQASRAGEDARQKAEADRQKAADDKQNAETEARRSAALQEAAWLLNLDEEEGKDIDPEGVFQHKNGFVFSNSSICEGIDYAARLSAAKALFNRRMNEFRDQVVANPAANPGTGFEIPHQ